VLTNLLTFSTPKDCPKGGLSSFIHQFYVYIPFPPHSTAITSATVGSPTIGFFVTPTQAPRAPRQPMIGNWYMAV